MLVDSGANTPLPNNTFELEPSKLITAMLPIPLTLATATLFAVLAKLLLPASNANVALATVPVILAPVILLNKPPSPLN